MATPRRHSRVAPDRAKTSKRAHRLGLSEPLVSAKLGSAESNDVLRWSQRAIDLAEGDPSKGNFIIGSPLAFAFS